jgi:FkbM family methyltransferase
MTVTRHSVRGYVIYSDISYGGGMKWVTEGSYEKGYHDLIEEFLDPDMTFIDVGACVGDYTLHVAKILKKGKVVSFEPHPDAFKWLSLSLKENGFKHVHLVNAAVGEESKMTCLYLGKRPGWSSVTHRWDESKKVEVPLVTLDDYLEHQERVDFIKIDTEGSENRVLEGASKIIKRHRPKILVETHPGIGGDVEETRRILQSHGYKTKGTRHIVTR